MITENAAATADRHHVVFTRRTVLHGIGIGAGAAWLARSGTGAAAAISGSQPTDGDAAPYVVTQRFQVPTQPLLTQLMSIIEATLLPALAEKEGFLDLLLFNSGPDELTIVSIYGDKRGAERAFAFAGNWIATDESGAFLEYIAHRGFGEQLRYFKTESVAALTPIPGTSATVELTPGPYTVGDDTCGYCVQRWPTEPGVIERAVAVAIAEQLVVP